MSIINILSYSLNEDNLHQVTAHHRIPDTNYTIQFVDTHEKRLVRYLEWSSLSFTVRSAVGTVQRLRRFRSNVHRTSTDDVTDVAQIVHPSKNRVGALRIERVVS